MRRDSGPTGTHSCVNSITEMGLNAAHYETRAYRTIFSAILLTFCMLLLSCCFTRGGIHTLRCHYACLTVTGADSPGPARPAQLVRPAGRLAVCLAAWLPDLPVRPNCAIRTFPSPPLPANTARRRPCGRARLQMRGYLPSIRHRPIPTKSPTGTEMA